MYEKKNGIIYLKKLSLFSMKDFIKNIFFLFILSLFSACFQQDKEKSNLAIFKYNQANGISSLDPAFARNQANIWATSQLFNGLVQLDDNLAIQACIAKKWQMSTDGKQITFTLRNDVFFQDDPLFKHGKGRKVVADDVVFSFNRIIDEKVASPGAWIFNDLVSRQNPFVAINDTTFVLHLQKAFRPILGMLTMPYCYIVPKEVVSHYGKDFGTHPIGTGPFKLKVWEEGTALVALKNKNYFETFNGDKLPYLDGFKISFMENKKMEFLHFMKGELDMISGIDKSFMNQVFDEKGNLQSNYKNTITLYKTPYLNTEYLGIRIEAKNNILQNKKIRQALNHCFDRTEMLQYLRKNLGIPAYGGIVPPGLSSYDTAIVKGYHYEPEIAKKLLKEANYKGEIITLHTVENYKDIAMYISNAAKNIGLNIKIEVVQPAILREWMSSEHSDFFRASWIADYPDAENYLSLFYSKNSAPPNYTRFKNETYDLLYEKSLAENNDALRNTYYQQMDNIIIDEATIVPLFYDVVIRFTQKNISNIRPDAFNMLYLKSVKKSINK